jgi:hypothetical protein
VDSGEALEIAVSYKTAFGAPNSRGGRQRATNYNAANRRAIAAGVRPAAPEGLGYLSSQRSSMHQPLKMLLTMIVNPLTKGGQQVARRS